MSANNVPANAAVAKSTAPVCPVAACHARLMAAPLGQMHAASMQLVADAQRWQRYEQGKAAFLAAHPDATADEIEAACKAIAEEHGG